MQSHRSTVPGSTSANSLKLIASKSSPDLDKTDKSLAATEKTSAPIVPSPAEQRQLEFVVADFSEADKKLADSLEEFQRTEFGFYVFESERNAPAKSCMSRWLEACCASLDNHFTDLVTLVSRRPGMNEQTGVYESERLVRGALLQHKLSPAVTLFHVWRRFTVLGRLPFGIGEDGGRSVGEKLTPFCFRYKKAIWTHLRRLREKELARIDLRLPDQRSTQVHQRNMVHGRKAMPTKCDDRKAAVIFTAIRQSLKGEEYCNYLHDHGIKTSLNPWVKAGCPSTYPEAYRDRNQRWRELIHKEKSRFKSKMDRLEANDRPELERIMGIAKVSAVSSRD